MEERYGRFVVAGAMIVVALLLALYQNAYAADPPIVVSMGDSYSSGEGVEDFYGQWDDKYHNQDWLAHRSEEAWPGQLVIDGHTLKSLKESGEWRFVAASGAEIRHVLTDGQDVQFDAVDMNGTATRRSDTLPCQLKVFSEPGVAGAVDYVTLTIGGNDLGFAHIIEVACKDDVWIPWLREGDLDAELRQAVEAFDRETLTKLDDAYGKIGEAAGEQAEIIVAGYPHLFGKDGMTVDTGNTVYNVVVAGTAGVDAEEAANINRAVDIFDVGVRQLIEGSGKDNLHFADPRPYFNGHEAELMNPVWNYPKEQDLKQGEGDSSAYSVHPNKDGQAAYAKAVQDVIDALEKGAPKKTQNVDIDSDVAMSLVFDVSGSMDDMSGLGSVSKLESAKRQSTDFVSAIRSQGGDDGMSVKVGVASFSDSSQIECGLSNDPNDINAAIDDLYASGMTNMYAGLATGIDQLNSDDGQKLMVFLSDGLSNVGPSSSEILTLAQDAADAGIKIYTIGFGSSGDIDEQLLQDIASITGGAYAHEDSSDIMAAAVGLFATMMTAQLSATSQVLISDTGTVTQDDTTQVGDFDVTGNGTLKTYLYWPGSVLDMQLTDPEGTVVTESYPGYSADTSTIPTSLSIENARAGTWQMSVYGAEVSMENEPFYAVAAFDETEVPAAAPPAGGGGGAASGGEGMLFVLIVVAAACIFGVFAFSRRRGSKG